MKVRRSCEECFVVSKNNVDVVKICPNQKILQVLNFNQSILEECFEFLFNVSKILKWSDAELLSFDVVHEISFLFKERKCFVPMFLLTGEQTYLNYESFQIICT